MHDIAFINIRTTCTIGALWYVARSKMSTEFKLTINICCIFKENLIKKRAILSYENVLDASLN